MGPSFHRRRIRSRCWSPQSSAGRVPCRRRGAPARCCPRNQYSGGTGRWCPSLHGPRNMARRLGTTAQCLHPLCRNSSPLGSQDQRQGYKDLGECVNGQHVMVRGLLTSTNADLHMVLLQAGQCCVTFSPCKSFVRSSSRFQICSNSAEITRLHCNNQNCQSTHHTSDSSLPEPTPAK